MNNNTGITKTTRINELFEYFHNNCIFHFQKDRFLKTVFIEESIISTDAIFFSTSLIEPGAAVRSWSTPQWPLGHFCLHRLLYMLCRAGRPSLRLCFFWSFLSFFLHVHDLWGPMMEAFLFLTVLCRFGRGHKSLNVTQVEVWCEQVKDHLFLGKTFKLDFFLQILPTRHPRMQRLGVPWIPQQCDEQRWAVTSLYLTVRTMKLLCTVS